MLRRRRDDEGRYSLEGLTREEVQLIRDCLGNTRAELRIATRDARRADPAYEESEGRARRIALLNDLCKLTDLPLR